MKHYRIEERRREGWRERERERERELPTSIETSCIVQRNQKISNAIIIVPMLSLIGGG